jgi:DNA polymerase III alpha subunit
MKFDIDVDMADRLELLNAISGYTNATIIKNGKAIKHNSGVYFTDVPSDPITNTCTIDHKDAEDRGYLKFDLLNVGVYKQVKNEEHLIKLMNTEPPWHRLTEEPFAEQLIHIGKHTDFLKEKQPKSIPQMAMFLAILRPGKSHLRNSTWKEIGETVWQRDDAQGYTFRKSHAVSYAHLVVVHMNLLNVSGQDQ